MAYRTSLPLHPTEDDKPKKKSIAKSMFKGMVSGLVSSIPTKKIGGKQGPRAGESDKGGKDRKIIKDFKKPNLK